MKPRTLLERLQWILTARGLSQRELSKRAGLNPNHLGTTMHRLRSNPDADIERDTLGALARAGDVGLEWLAEGKGAPDASSEAAVHPNLRAALDRLRGENRISEQAAAVLVAMGRETPVDMDPETWALAALDVSRSLKSKT